MEGSGPEAVGERWTVSKGYHDGGVGMGTASVTRESHVVENGQRMVRPRGGQVGASDNP